MTNRSENAMLTGGILKPIMAFFFPILIGAFFQQLYNTVDAVVVGQFAGTQALASVGGSAGQMLGFVFNFFMGLATGSTVIIAQGIGAKKPEEVDVALHTSYMFALVGGLALGILGVILTNPLLSLLQTPQDTFASSGTYMRILFAGLVFTLIYNMGSGILRAAGDSRRPLYILIICCLVNIVLDVLAVAGLGLGVMGAAVATDISQAVSAILITMILVRRSLIPPMEADAAGLRDTEVKLTFRKLRMDPRTLGKILKIGLPTAISISMFSIANMVLQVSVNRMGVNTVAAWTAYSRVDALWWMIDGAFSTSVTTFVGQNYGARLAHRIRKGVREVLLIEIATGAVMSFLFIHFGNILLSMFTTETEVIAIGMMLAALISPFYAVYAVNEVLAAALRAEGYVMFTTAANLLGIFVFRIIWLRGIFPDGTLRQIMWCYPISWTLISVIVAIYYIIRQRKTLKALAQA